MKYFQLNLDTLYGYSDLTVRPFTVFNSDNEETFKENLLSQPDDWTYRKKEIVYERNEFGHRTKSLSDLREDFILFTGCSFTEGIGLATEDTYPAIVSEDLRLDFYNLALASSGPDLIYKNLTLWFKNVKRLPKYVVIQQTYPDRAFIPKNGGILPLGPWFPRIPKGLLTPEEKDRFEHLVMSEACEHYFDIMREQFNLYMNTLNIRVIEIDPDSIEKLDFARDLKHPGIVSHRSIASRVFQAIQASSNS